MIIGSMFPPLRMTAVGPSGVILPANMAATPVAPEGSTTILARSSSTSIARAVSSSLTVTTSSTLSLMISKFKTPGFPTAIPSEIVGFT